MEENDIAANPRPVHHRIPNFVNAELTAKQAKKSVKSKRSPLVELHFYAGSRKLSWPILT